jgi:thiamine phosphate synthase YjbQ (UPF0047 family)
VCEPRSSSRKISSTHIAQTRLSIATAPREIKEITAEVARWTERQRISVGLLTLYIPHTSAPLLIQENASPDVGRDLDAFCLASCQRMSRHTATMTKGRTTCRPTSRAR